jgi:hypothetical protein
METTDPKKRPNYVSDENNEPRNTQYEKFQDGPQGNDKAPGEDVARGNENVMAKAQKGTKNDGDPSEPGDQPAE